MIKIARKDLERLYRKYNRRRHVHPDPLEFLYAYPAPPDREIVALVASALAYGRVAQILASVERVLEILGPSPAGFLEKTAGPALKRRFRGFVHRFARGDHLAGLLAGTRSVIARFGSLEGCFTEALGVTDATVIPALTRFSGALRQGAGIDPGHLLPDPSRGSACKRMNLFLRWMVRCDRVDPGGWSRVSPARLVIPLDTHMHRFGLMAGLTRRKQGNLRTAIEITERFREISPEDPARYDFSLTRIGMRGDTDFREVFKN
jgi:uncharacterized protein (TIGR02757 family)